MIVLADEPSYFVFMQAKRCIADTKKGVQCKKDAVDGFQFCRQHVKSKSTLASLRRFFRKHIVAIVLAVPGISLAFYYGNVTLTRDELKTDLHNFREDIIESVRDESVQPNNGTWDFQNFGTITYPELDAKLKKKHELGLEALERGAMLEAESIFRSLVDLMPKSGGFRINLASALLAQKKIDEADLQAEKAIALEPKEQIYRAIKSMVLREQGKFEESKIIIRRLLTIAKPAHPLHFELGTILYDQDSATASILEYKRALEGEPKNPIYLHNLGLAYKKADSIDQALVVIEQAYDIDTTLSLTKEVLVSLLEYKGRIHWDRNEFDSTAFYWRRAMSLNPESGRIEFNYGWALAKLGRTNEANLHIQIGLQRLDSAELSQLSSKP